MKKEQAQEKFHKLMSGNLTIADRSDWLARSEYPETDRYYWEYMHAKLTLQEFESKCVKYIQLSDTKLFQILK